MAVPRHVRFTESFWQGTRRAFTPERTPAGRPSIIDFERVALEAIRFAFASPGQLTPAEPGSPVMLVVLRPSPAFPSMSAYGFVVADADGEVVDVEDIAVDWDEWEALRREGEAP